MKLWELRKLNGEKKVTILFFFCPLDQHVQLYRVNFIVFQFVEFVMELLICSCDI